MATALKTQSCGTVEHRKPKATEYTEPKRFSKAWQWRLNNPSGIFTVLDWKAVNK